MNLDKTNAISLTSLKESLGIVKKLSKRFHRYANIIEKGFISKQEVITLKSILSNNGLKGNLTDIEIDKLKDIHVWNGKPEYSVKINDEHTAQGLNFLKGLYKTPTGKLKRICKLDQLDVPNGYCDNESMMSIIENFKEFRYAGFIENWNGFRETYAPVWEVVSNNGSSFTYVQTFSGFWRG